MIKKIFFVFLLIAAISGTGYFSYHAYANFQESLKKKELTLRQKKADWLALKRYVGREVARFKGTAGIIVKDLDTGWEYSYRGERLFPSASMVKIPIMAAVFQSERDGKLTMDQLVTMVRADQNHACGNAVHR
jgi:beta-lactamase class A